MKLRFVILFIALALAACGGPMLKNKNFRSAEDTRNITPHEDRLWLQSQRLDRALTRSGRIYQDPGTTAYVQSVMDRLFPEFKGRIRVRLINSTYLNAFALPNGSIYLHIGLLARMENEAQLAAVLSHEAIHFVNKHSYKQRRNIKGMSAFAMGAGLLGVPLLGDILALSSIYGYSRELESEADSDGYRRYLQAGYPAAEAYRVFQLLLDEVKALKIRQPFFFSTHPKLQERIKNYKQLARSHKGGGGSVNKQAFIRRTATVRMQSLKLDLSLNRYQSIILILEDKRKRADYPPEAGFYLAEAYRRRAEKGDGRRAFAMYRQTVKQAPAFAPTYRALGVHHMKRKHYKQAQWYFARYLQLAPDAKDRKYIENYYAIVTKKGD